VLVCTCITYKKDLWLYVLEIRVGNEGAILAQGSRNIQRPRGHAEPIEVGVLCQVVLELIIIVFCKKGRQKESCDLNFAWNKFKQCRQEDVKRNQCPI